MGKCPRIGLLLGAASCLLAVMFDWIVMEFKHPDPGTAQSVPVPQTSPSAEPATATPYTA